MVKEQLIIEGVTIPIDKGISTVLTFSIKDIQQPDKVKSSFSKTIKLPGSKAINDKLNFIFEVNSDSTFNPNLKLDAVYYQNDIAVFSGFIQLKDIIKKDYNQVDYSVVLFGETANIFRELGNKFLNDAGMNWQEFDHNYTQVNQENSWDTSYILNGAVEPFQYGSGLTYPMCNYGNDTDIEVYNVTEMFPAIYVKEYIDRMFADSGYTYTSTFFNSSLFKHLIIPFNGKEFKPTQTDLSPRRVVANTPLFLNSGLDNLTISSFSTAYGVISSNTLRLSNEVLDVNNQYDPATGVLTVGDTGFYRITFDVIIQTETTPLLFYSGTAVNLFFSTFINSFKIIHNGTVVNAETSYTRATDPLTPYTTYTTANPTTYPDENFTTSAYWPTQTQRNHNPPNKYQVSIDIQLQAGDLITIGIDTSWDHLYVQWSSSYLPPEYAYYKTSNQNNVPVDLKIILASATLSFDILDAPYSEGDYINMYSAIPEKIKQRDFLTSIIKMFNLYMIPDESNPKNILIETREDFYTTDIIDWSKKLDYSKAHNLTPTAVTNKQKYIYTYKKDADYYNKKYESSWQDIYGVRNIYLDNDFNKTDHKTELIFSPTPLVGQLASDRVVPTIIGVDSNLQQKTTKSNIRILYYGGLKPSIINWTHAAIAGDVIQPTYPYSGHFDDPYNPSLDINFGLPKEIYYDSTYGSITVTNNNLYLAYHRKELEQLTDKDSKVFKGYFLLNPVDIANLSFRPSYFFENEYWTLHKVMYSSSIYQPSKCEFLKLKEIPTSPIIFEQLKGGIASIGDEDLPFIYNEILSGGNVLSTKSNTVDGLNNFIDKSAMFVDIKGDNNKVFTGSKNITIQGDNNVIEPGLENVSLINTSNVTVTESNTTYINGQIKGAGSVETITTNTTADEMISTYLCDTSAGSISISLPDFPTVGKVWNFKKIAVNNNLQIRVSALRSIDGQLVKNITALNNSYSIQFCGDFYKII